MAKAISEAEAAPYLPEPLRKNRHYIYCPGCYAAQKERYPDEPRFWMNGALHCFSTDVHQYNGNEEAPTLSPSLLVTYCYGEEKTPYICHSFVKDGRIQFLSDCTHPLRGQTVDLMDVPTPTAN
jgi:hypothetical protein